MLFLFFIRVKNMYFNERIIKINILNKNKEIKGDKNMEFIIVMTIAMFFALVKNGLEAMLIVFTAFAAGAFGVAISSFIGLIMAGVLSLVCLTYCCD